MKNKWIKLAAFLGITKFESSAEGVFMTEAQIDQMEAVRVKNEELEASIIVANEAKDTAVTALATAETAHTAATSAQDEKILKLTEDLAAANKKVSKVEGVQTEGGGKDKKDPAATGEKRKLTARERSLARTAAAFRGEEYVEDTDEDEDEDNGESMKETETGKKEKDAKK